MKFHTVLNRAAIAALVLVAGPTFAQSFRVQCPTTTTLHRTVPAAGDVNPVGGQIKCQEIAGGDGYATMGDGHQIYLFGFGPLSGRDNIASGKPGTLPAADFLLDRAGSANAAAIEPAAIMNNGVLSAQQPAPMMAIDEDDEYFLTLSNVGMIMRPDLFEQHTVHFHGYPNASAFFDGVPDASVAINIAGSFTYYYTAPDAGTYFWHCHITPPEHLQMGMVGQLYVRPRQNRVADGTTTSDDLRAALIKANIAAAVNSTSGLGGTTCTDILCTGQTPAPSVQPVVSNSQPKGSLYAYNDGDGSTRYDVEYPIQMMGFDPNFHYVGMTFNPEMFADMKDKYFMLSGRSYPDTISPGNDAANPGNMQTLDSDGTTRTSQPVRSAITLTQGQRALLRVSDLAVTEFHTLATVGIPMTVIADNARLLRDLKGNNLYYQTNSITMGGGESTDVILDTCTQRTADYTGCATGAFIPTGTYYLYTTNLDHLSNDAENFGGMMTEIVVQ
jgi:FtsP/CotA-like multicopper oxidase with cupredoxin domain